VSKDDPFAPFIDDEKTILRPNPGGIRVQPKPSSPVFPSISTERGSDLEHLQAYKGVAFNHNPLISTAMPLLALIAPLKGMSTYDSVPTLHALVIDKVKKFESEAVQRGAAPDQARTASYALCSLLDETILSTPWGAHSFWVHQSLLVKFHGDAWGGEKVFDLLNSMLLQPGSHLHLIEFFWLVLCLGFKGKYGVINQGANALEDKRQELYLVIKRLRGDEERDLSAYWQGFKDARLAITQYIPLWAIVVGTLLFLVLAYLGFSYFLNQKSDTVARDFYGLSKLVIQPVTVVSQPPPVNVRISQRAERFRRILAEDIKAGKVEVVDDRIIRIRDSFASGSDKIKPAFLPMITKIAQEIVAGKDTVLITGHTDDVPIFTAKFPSNFDLSNARANHVAAYIRKISPPDVKLRCEGRADFEPLAANDGAENRAKNRRVDILIQ